MTATEPRHYPDRGIVVHRPENDGGDCFVLPVIMPDGTKAIQIRNRKVPPGALTQQDAQTADLVLRAWIEAEDGEVN